MLYNVAVTPLTVKETLQVIDLVQTLGWYKLPTGKIDYPCTTNMVDQLCLHLKGILSNLSIDEKVDLAIALMVIPLDPVLGVVDKCLSNVTVVQFDAGCFNLVTSTNYFEDFIDRQFQFIEEKDLSIGLLSRYLDSCKQDVTALKIRDQVRKITSTIKESRYGAANSMVTTDEGEVDNPSTHACWNRLELTTCDKGGRHGPSLGDCIKAYNTEWVRDDKLFTVAPNRPGIQIVTIPKTGLYKITARGAGNHANTGSGTVFHNVRVQKVSFFINYATTCVYQNILILTQRKCLRL